MQHFRLLRMIRVDQAEFNHQLAAVTDPQTQRIVSRIEIIQRFFGLRIV